jgi:PAS domain S-box-containing protein
MSFEQLSKEELVERLRLVGRDGDGADAVGAHELELEAQNRSLREMQRTLEESRARYAELYDSAPLASFTFDENGCVLEANLAGASMVGGERGALLGVPFVSLVRFHEPTAFWAHLHRCAETRARGVNELCLAGAEGARVIVQAISTPVLSPLGRVVAYRTAFTDVTALRQAEADEHAARTAEAQLRALLEAVDGAALRVTSALADVHEPTEAVLQTITEQATLLTGADYGALSLGDRVIVSPRCAELEQFLSGARGVEPGVLPVVDPPVESLLGVPLLFGEARLGNLYVANRRGGGFSPQDQHCLEMLAERVCHAIQIARLREAQRRDHERLQAAVRSRDNVMAIVSHDLRNPLNAIALNLSLLTRPWGGEGPDRRKGRGQLESIKRSVQRVSRMTEDLLAASTIQSGHFSVRAGPELPDVLLADLVQTLEPMAQEQGITLEPSFPPGLPMVLCDRDRVLQVFGNLCGNALHVTPRGGVIRVTAQRDGAFIRFCVSDTGPGLLPSQLASVFDRYWQAEPGSSSGVGLGLYIVKGIVEAHGGRAWAGCAAGEGASFFFTLPIAP